MFARGATATSARRHRLRFATGGDQTDRKRPLRSPRWHVARTSREDRQALQLTQQHETWIPDLAAEADPHVRASAANRYGREKSRRKPGWRENEVAVPQQDDGFERLPCHYCGGSYEDGDLAQYTEPVNCGPCSQRVGKLAFLTCRLMFCVCDVRKYRG